MNRKKYLWNFLTLSKKIVLTFTKFSPEWTMIHFPVSWNFPPQNCCLSSIYFYLTLCQNKARYKLKIYRTKVAHSSLHDCKKNSNSSHTRPIPAVPISGTTTTTTTKSHSAGRDRHHFRGCFLISNRRRRYFSAPKICRPFSVTRRHKTFLLSLLSINPKPLCVSRFKFYCPRKVGKPRNTNTECERGGLPTFRDE